MGRLFGTDGVRGVANRELTAELALALGAAAARRLADVGSTGRRVAVVGRDPRASGEMLEAAVIAGLTSAGRRRAAGRRAADPGGGLPDPRLRRRLRRDDLGLAQPDARQRHQDLRPAAATNSTTTSRTEIEELVAAGPGLRPVGAGIGRVVDAEDADERYLRHVGRPSRRRLDGLTVVVDCAHGAASSAAPRAYRAAGANVIAINAEPNGLNINDDCGSTHLESVRAAVLAHGADLGLAHDGDADRCLAVDADGELVDGDAIMVVLRVGHARAPAS